MPADRSPFPGMDPWLEASSGDVHHEPISEYRRQIAPQLPADLFAVVEETVYVAVDDWGEQTYRPDVTMFTPHPVIDGSGTGGSAVVAEPIRMIVQEEPVTEGRIEIRHLGSGDPVVTGIEVLSPKNKLSADGRTAYLAPRRQYRRGGVNLVEVDLLRGGPNLTGLPHAPGLDPRLRSAYRCVVRRPLAAGGTALDTYPLPLRERLPAMIVPLRPDDRPVAIDLQMPIDVVYQLGGYGRRIDYARPPDPPLSADDAAWAAGCVAAARSPLPGV